MIRNVRNLEMDELHEITDGELRKEIREAHQRVEDTRHSIKQWQESLAPGAANFWAARLPSVQADLCSLIEEQERRRQQRNLIRHYASTKQNPASPWAIRRTKKVDGK
jgi:hypothetical protein